MIKKIHSFFHRHYHTRYHGIYKHAKQLFVFDLGLMGLALAMLGASIFFFFWKPGISDLMDLKISIGDERIKSGQEVELVFKYANRSKQKIHDVKLAVRLPDGFVVNRNATPTNTFSGTNVFALPDLLPGANGQTSLKGRLWSEIGGNDRIIASLSYVPEKQTEREQKLSSYIVNLPESILKTELKVATSSFYGRPVALEYSITNTGEAAVQNIDILPSVSLEGTNIKDLKRFSLEPGATKKIAASFALPGNKNGFSFSVGSAILINNHYIHQNSLSQTIVVLKPDLQTSAAITNNPSFIEPGMVLPIKLYWRNNGGFNFNMLKMRINVTPGTVDLAKTAKENNLKIEGNGFVVDKQTRTALANGKPGADDTFNINLYLLSAFSLPSGVTMFQIIPELEGVADGMPEPYIQSGQPVKIPCATDLRMTPSVRYYTPEGDQLGRGPLPPVVGEITKYWIFIQITNTANPVSNASFNATLSPGIQFTGKQSVSIGPQMTYNQSDNSVSWSYRELPANSQTGLFFEVAATPSPNQIGQTIPLIKNLRFSANDEVVGKEFNLSNKGLSNALNASDLGSSYGAQVISR